MDEKTRPSFQSRHEFEMNQRNNAHHLDNLNRYPTLSEILTRKSQSPVDLWSFYVYMRYKQQAIDYLDFWLDSIRHLSLCKHYVKGLRESILLRNSSQFNLLNEKRDSHLLQSAANIRDSGTSDFVDYNESNRNSAMTQDQQQQRHKSLSSSMLLDMIVNDNILEDYDSVRLSQFLRGDLNVDESDPKLQALLQEYNSDRRTDSMSSGQLLLHSQPLQPPQQMYEKRVSSHSQLLADLDRSAFPVDEASDANYIKPSRPTKLSSVNPELLEDLIRESNNGHLDEKFVSRATLKESSRNLLLKYFVDNAEKRIYIPQQIVDNVIQSIEVEGRDDPDVFQAARDYVFKAMESETYPAFLAEAAIANITDHSYGYRFFIGLFVLFLGFWLGYSLVFLGKSRSLRVVVLPLFLIGCYLVVGAIWYIDPILCFMGYSETIEPKVHLVRLDEKFVRKVLRERSAWVLFVVLVFTAILTVIFSVVPGHHL